MPRRGGDPGQPHGQGQGAGAAREGGRLLSVDELKAVIAACDGPLLVDRRDQARILLYADTGVRLSKLGTARLDNLDLRERSLLVVGKGNRERVLPFGARRARAVDGYLQIRARQPYAERPWLWLSGKDGRGLTANGIQQMLRRREKRAGIVACTRTCSDTGSQTRGCVRVGRKVT